MTPGKYNIVVPQGASYDTTVVWSVDGATVDLTGYSAVLQARTSPRAEEDVLFLESGGGGYPSPGITLGAFGDIRIFIPNYIFLSTDPGTYVYDLLLYTDTVGYRLLEGKFIITPRVSHVPG